MDKAAPPGLAVQRYRQLDSLRGLGALSVFIAHFISLKMATPLLNTLHQTPLGILCNGTAALMMFFVLSGFVLSLPYVNGDRPLSLGEFYIKRIFRIYPAYLFAILIAVLLKQFLFNRDGLAPYSNWLNNFWSWNWDKESPQEILKTLLLVGPDFKINYIDPPIWSLVIEMKMSFILPFFILAVSRGGKLFNIGFLLVIAWLTYQYNAWAIAVFYIGVLSARYKDDIMVHIRAWPVLKTAVIVIIALLLYNNNYELVTTLKQLEWPHKYVFSYYTSAVGSWVILMIVLSKERPGTFLQKRVFTFFGDISYSFYLIQVPLILTVGSLISNHFLYSSLLIFLAAFAAAIASSYLMSICIERTFQQLAIRLVKRYRLKGLIKLDQVD